MLSTAIFPKDFTNKQIDLDISTYSDLIKNIEKEQHFEQIYQDKGGKKTDLLSILNHVIALNRKLKNSYTALSKKLKFAQEYKSLSFVHEEMLKLDYECNAFYYYRGTIKHYKGLADAAIQDFTCAIVLNSKDASSFLRRGIDYYGQDKNELAIDDFSMAISLDPQKSMAYAYRGMAQAKNNQLDKAITDLTHFINIEKDIDERDIAVAHHHLGLIHCKKAQNAAAYESGIGEALWHFCKAENSVSDSYTQLNLILDNKSKQTVVDIIKKISERKKQIELIEICVDPENKKNPKTILGKFFGKRDIFFNYSNGMENLKAYLNELKVAEGLIEKPIETKKAAVTGFANLFPVGSFGEKKEGEKKEIELMEINDLVNNNKINQHNKTNKI